MGSERVEKVLDDLFGQVELIWAGVGEKRLFGAQIGKSEGGRGRGSGRGSGSALPF